MPSLEKAAVRLNRMDRSSYLTLTNAALISVVFSVLLAIGVIVFYTHEDRHTKTESLASLASLATAKQVQLTDWFDDEIQDANVITRDNSFVKVIEAYQKGEENQSQVLDMLHQVRLEHLYADLILLDTLGDHHLSTNPALAFNDSIDKIYYSKARLTDSCLVSELYRSTIDNRVYIDIIAAIKNKNGTNLGGVVFKIRPEHSLDGLLTDWNRLAGRCDLSLLWEQSDGHWLTYSPLVNQLDTGSCWQPLTATQRAKGLEKHLITGQSPPEKAFFTISPLPNVPWHLLVELDDSYRLNRLRALLDLIILIVVILVMLGFLSVFLVIRYQQGKHITSYLTIDAELVSMRRQYQLTMDVLQEAVVVTDGVGRIRFLNLMAESLTGWKQAVVAGKPLDEVLRLTRQGTGVPLFHVRGWLQGDKAMTRFENAWLVNKAGQTIRVSCSLAYLPSTVPSKDGLLLTIKDETAVQAQQQLTLENENRFKHLFQDAPDAFLLVDSDGRIRLANVLAVTLFGYSPEELLEKRVNDLVPASQVAHGEDFKAYLKQPGKKIMGQGCRLQGLCKDGRLFDAVVTISPILDKEEMLAMVVVRDITEMVEKETRLRLNASIINNMREGVLLFSLNKYTVLFSNPRLRTMFGYTEEEMSVIGIKDLLANDEPFIGYLSHNMTFIKPETLNVDHTLRCVTRKGALFLAAAHIYTFEYGSQGTVLIAVLQEIPNQHHP